MKTTQWILIMCIAVFIFGTIACGGGKYADAKKAVAESNKALEDFLGKMDTADNAKDIAAALTAFANEMEKIAPEMRKLEEKYPELKESQSIPEELGEVGNKMKELWGKFGTAMIKIQEYADDPEVKKAQEKLQGIMSGL
ncbi:MAG: hypothetical protein PVH84_02380 [Candidatus Aminicenantes bacterium]|jgi:hypothetical protein